MLLHLPHWRHRLQLQHQPPRRLRRPLPQRH
jgi:hypothetical protein